MYRSYFGLKELPFSIAPNPRYLYLTHQHQEALAHLIYGLNSAGGVILLTGEVGTGKTTISRKLLEDLPNNIDIAWIVNPRLSVEELLAAICDELSINYPAGNHSIKIFTDLISDCLIQAHSIGHNVVLMIDEAQNLSPEVLEQLRLLTNLETSERKLLQIVLLGQPELKTMLERNDLRQLAQRITARYHLQPLNRKETSGYIRHRLAVSGCSRPIFSPRVMKQIYRCSHGTPRLINLLCDRAMLGAYSTNTDMVHPKHVRQASTEVLGDSSIQKRPVFIPIALVLSLIIIGFFASGAWKQLANNEFQSPSKQVTSILPAPMPTTATDETELIQTPESEFNDKSSLETPPVQSPEIASAIDKGDIEINPPNEIPIDLTKRDIAIKTTTIEKHKPLTKVRTSVWDDIEKNGSKTLAFQTLANIWHSSINSTDGKPCKHLSNPKLSCLKQHANIWLLRQINRPALFRIIGQDSLSHYGVIRFITQRYAYIALGNQQWRVDISDLKLHMQDRIDVIWFKPPGYQTDLQLGDSGIAVEWLGTQLDRIQGSMIPPRQVHSMDDVLVERLKYFQKSEGMIPDGIGGILTLMRINKRIGLDMPTLLHEAKH